MKISTVLLLAPDLYIVPLLSDATLSILFLYFCYFSCRCAIHLRGSDIASWPSLLPRWCVHRENNCLSSQSLKNVCMCNNVMCTVNKHFDVTCADILMGKTRITIYCFQCVCILDTKLSLWLYSNVYPYQRGYKIIYIYKIVLHSVLRIFETYIVIIILGWGKQLKWWILFPLGPAIVSDQVSWIAIYTFNFQFVCKSSARSWS